MKNITSISVTIRDGDNFRAIKSRRIYRGNGVEEFFIKKLFPGNPKPPYKVTYSLFNSKKGIPVLDGRSSIDNDWLCDYPIIRVNKRSLPVCFMPPEWIGRKVSRKVEKLGRSK